MTQEINNDITTTDEEIIKKQRTKIVKPLGPEYFNKQFYHRYYGCNEYTCPICRKTLSNNQKI